MPVYRLTRMVGQCTMMTSFDWGKIFSAPKYVDRIRPFSPEGFGNDLETKVVMDEAARDDLWEDFRDIDIVPFSAEIPAAAEAAA